MKTDTPKVIKLNEYKKPNYMVLSIDLVVYLENTETLVQSKMKIKRNNSEEVSPLVLNGEELLLKSVVLNGNKLSLADYVVDGDLLTITDAPDEFVLEIENIINPEANKTLDGLYKSGNIFCTQNEPEGFRRITYYVDRPDNMAKFTTKIIADKKLYPVLLSNGNPTARGDLDGGKHFVTWEDPFKKPSYLYALVAGDLGSIKDTYMTTSGRTVALEIYCDKGNEDKCHHAMTSLKKSMKWDEDRFGLEYDLDIYMIVAVDAFNMGAMENKGLNIFNSAYVLANPKTATDSNFYGIESVIGHEYFHNWTGNRVTCRDWFQLTLKEGLTVFRDQEFSADLNSRNVERIQSVLGLRANQFAEDAGPTSHPIKPESYIEINNFYTSTIYEKGAEVIRMIQTLLGVDGFRKGMDLYFQLFDGQAVRTEDFIFAMSEANNHFDFSQFKNWYNQNGTPIVHATTHYDAAKKQFKLILAQELPKNTIPKALPFHIPFKVGLVGASGKDLVCKTLELKKEKEEFIFNNINELPIASLNRDFSAPIKLISDLSFSDQLFLMAHDSDSFNRFEATQVVALKLMKELIEDIKAHRPLKLNEQYVEAFGKILKDPSIDEAFRSLSMTIPSEGILHQEQDEILYPETKAARDFVKKTLALAHHETLLKLYESTNLIGEYKLDPISMGRRALKGNCLYFLTFIDGNLYKDLPLNQFKTASNMTDEIGALTTLVDSNSAYKAESIKDFYTKWKHETLVMQKWLMVQGAADHDSTYDNVLKLENDPIYDRTIPNLVRALLGQFAMNKIQFNHSSGRGYQLIADRMIEIDKLNPQVASRLASAYKDYKRLPANLKSLMKPELEKILATNGLSKNVFEIVSKILA